jgi:hypothetical protein
MATREHPRRDTTAGPVYAALAAGLATLALAAGSLVSLQAVHDVLEHIVRALG